MSILKVNTIQDKGGNTIISSNGTGTFTPLFAVGKIGQVVFASTNTQLGANNQDSDTFNFQGTITPSATNSKILVLCTVNAMSNGGGGRMVGRIKWDTTSGGTSGTEVTVSQIANDSFDTSGMSSLTLQTLISPNTTSQIYVKNIVAKNDSGTQWYVQRYSNYSYMTLMEVLA